ncbi:MAG TPA: TlpA disulfide reductase family protein [Actinomycetota bacterium]
MAETKQTTKRERQRAAAEARATARRRQQQRRTLAWALGGIALIAVVVLGVVALMGSEGGGTPSGSGQVSAAGPPRSQPLASGDAVPSFSGPAIGGGTVSWSDYAGGPAVVTVWAPWCPHCQTELPILDGVMRSTPDVGFVTVVTWIGDAPGPDPEAFMEENGLTIPTVIDDSTETIATALGVVATPTTFFVASDGTVVQMVEGEIGEDTLRQVIGSLT